VVVTSLNRTNRGSLDRIHPTFRQKYDRGTAGWLTVSVKLVITWGLCGLNSSPQLLPIRPDIGANVSHLTLRDGKAMHL
jgi:hypothetical protein